jgi:co-chaperonin GroES (HSP10)
MKIIPINNNIIFTFVDRVNAKGEFEREKTESGIYLQSSFDESAKSPRWVNVIAVGPECKTIKVGMQALLPNLRWTSNIKVDGQMVWRSDETQAVAYRETATADIKPLTNVVLFKQQAKEQMRPSGLLIVVGNSTDSPSGNVVSIGPDADPALTGSTIYYDDTNFTDTFSHAGVTLSFIKDDSILAFA